MVRPRNNPVPEPVGDTREPARHPSAGEEKRLPEQSRNRRFERIVMPHLDAAYNLARWLLRDATDAEDVLQEALLRAHRFLDSCREETARQWVLRIVRNACYDWLRGRSAVRLEELDEAVGEIETPESLLLKADERLLLDELIGMLPPDYREVIVLREFEELSYKEIAEIAGIPLGTVMSRLSRARGLLAKEWEKRNERA